MALEFFLPGETTSLNDYIAAMNKNRFEGAKIKKYETRRVELAARELPQVTKYPVDLHLTWYRHDKRTDPDNVAFAIKFILDGLQLAGVLQQDTWASVRSIHHTFEVDRNNPGCAVSIVEA